jgi:hypothetical protein
MRRAEIAKRAILFIQVLKWHEIKPRRLHCVLIFNQVGRIRPYDICNAPHYQPVVVLIDLAA